METQVTTKASELAACLENIAETEKHLKELKGRARELQEHELVEAMRQNSLSKANVMIGNHEYEVKLTNKIVGKLSDLDEAAAIDGLQYLADKGFSGAKEAQLTIRVPDDELDVYRSKLAEISGNDPAVKRNIHHQTLLAFARECLNNGDGFDLEKVGLRPLTQATIKEV